MSMKNTPEEYPPEHPWPVTIVLLFVLSITAWHGLRAWTTFANWELLSRFRANPIYTFATGIIWLVIGGVLFVILWKGNRIAPAFGLTASILYALWYWVDRLAIQTSPTTNIPFSIVIFIIGLVIFNLNLFWPSSRAFFKEIQ